MPFRRSLKRSTATVRMRSASRNASRAATSFARDRRRSGGGRWSGGDQVFALGRQDRAEPHLGAGRVVVRRVLAEETFEQRAGLLQQALRDAPGRPILAPIAPAPPRDRRPSSGPASTATRRERRLPAPLERPCDPERDPIRQNRRDRHAIDPDRQQAPTGVAYHFMSSRRLPRGKPIQVGQQRQPRLQAAHRAGSFESLSPL